MTLQELKDVCDSDNSEFWKKLGRVVVGYERKKKILMEVELEDGSTSSNTEEVLDACKRVYCDLLNCIRL